MRTTKNTKTLLKGRRTRAAISRKQAHERAIRDRTCSKVSHKLQALKNLIPPYNHSGADDDQTVKADQLFQETADYIILLRTQVVILQRLVQFYGSDSTEEEQNAVL